MLIFKKMKGFTTVELLIALMLNMVLFAALISAVVANLSHYRKSLNAARLNQQLQSVMDVMANDIRRAGYWGNARNDLDTGQNNNPFMTSGTDITISTGNDCILLTYDRDGNGSLPSVSSGSEDERYGFRLNGQNVQARPPGADFTCTAASSAWENLLDSNLIQVTSLTFTLTTKTITTGPGSRGLSMRSIDINLTGRLASDTSISKTLTQHVRIRNDKFIP